MEPPKINTGNSPPSSQQSKNTNLKQIPGQSSKTAAVLDTHVDGKRIAAGIVDLILVFILLSLTNQGGFINFKFTSQGYSVSTGPIVSLYGLKGLITIIAIALYFILFEAIKGATIGKMAASIKVVKEDGSKISFGSSVIRNVCRVIDGFPYLIPYLLGMIVMISNKERQRVGDKFAKTFVVKK